MSKNVGAAIDKVFEIDKKIDAVEQALRALKKVREKEELVLLKILQSSQIVSAAGKLARAFIDKREHPSIENRRSFDKYVLKHKALDLFQNRVSVEAWRSRRDAGDAVPGIKVFEKVSVRVRSR